MALSREMDLPPPPGPAAPIDCNDINGNHANALHQSGSLVQTVSGFSEPLVASLLNLMAATFAF